MNAFAVHSAYSDPGRYAATYGDLPETVEGCVQTIHGLLLHIFHGRKYGVPIPSERMVEVYACTIPEMLEWLFGHDPSPLTTSRPPERRLIGNCRDFSLLLASMLRARGIPARIRAGFETYFHRDGRLGDHWLCEYWNANTGRWVVVDAQLDELHCRAFKIDFDPLDVPSDKWKPAGEVWRRCADGELDPARCGILDMWGLDYIRGSLVRDVMCLNLVERFPWTQSALSTKAADTLSDTDIALLNHVSAITLGDVRLDEVRRIFAETPAMHPLPEPAIDTAAPDIVNR